MKGLRGGCFNTHFILPTNFGNVKLQCTMCYMLRIHLVCVDMIVKS